MPRPFAMTALATIALLSLPGCGGDDASGGGGVIALPTPSPGPAPTPTPVPAPTPTVAVAAAPIATLDSPWAMTFLPDGRMLVTEKPGRLRVVTTTGAVGPAIAGTPAVQASGQGGLLDVALDPAFTANGRVYLSFTEASGGAAGLALARGTLVLDGGNGGRIDNLTVIWRQAPKIAGDTRHYGGRIAFAPDGTLYLTAGERHQGAPAQDRATTLGKIVRINPDGSIPADNPFADGRREIWSLGHRNPYGLVFAADGRLWSSEMGPEGGDEFNLITRGANYGWRIVSEGNDGEVLPRHATRPEFAAPYFAWTPVIAPSGMIQYRGNLFVGWDRDFVLGGLVSQGLVRVRANAFTASEVGRVPLGRRIREVEQGPDGAIWVLEDGPGGRLVKLVPA